MRILQINSKVNVGSVSRITEHIGATVLDCGGESFIAYGRECRSTRSNTIRIGNKYNVYLHALGGYLFDAEGLFSAHSTQRLIRNIIKIDPDIIHLQNIHGHYINYPLLFNFLKDFKKPVVWTFHDCWPMTGHCSHFICENCEKWKTLCNNCPLKHSYPKSLILDNSKRNYVLKQQLFTSIDDLTIVAVSKWLASLVKESFLKNIPVEVIYNGVDTDVFKPTLSSLKSDLNLSEKKVLLGVATAWSKDKGLYDYVKLSEVLGDEYKIVLIGLSDKQMEELPDAIHKVPKTTNLQQLAMYYSMADIVLNLSYAESFGLTTVEGMACGTPGIVYNRTASPELVSENTGLVVEAGNIDQLCVAINNISSREKQYYSLTCRNRVLGLFDKTKNYNKYIDLYCRKI